MTPEQQKEELLDWLEEYQSDYSNLIFDEDIAMFRAIRRLVEKWGEWREQVKMGDWDKYSPVSICYEIRDFDPFKEE